MAGLFQNYNPLQKIAANQHGVSSAITSGSLISFSYPKSFAMIPNVIHDPYPMIILTDVYKKYIRGVNLHYLTFPYVKEIIEKFGSNPSFNYSMIQPNPYIANAFRMYARAGVLRPKRLDTEWLKTVLNSVRSFNPGEIEKIKANIQQQIQARLQAKAKELTSYEQWRKQLNQNQQRQLRGKVTDINQAVTRGNQENLIMPNPGSEVPDFSYLQQPISNKIIPQDGE